MNVISGQAGPGESEEPSYTFWKQGIPAVQAGGCGFESHHRYKIAI